MKTRIMIDLDDHLLADTASAASEEGVSLSAFIETAPRDCLDADADADEHPE